MSSLSSAILSLFKDCLCIRADESVLILVDMHFHDLGYQFYQIAQELTKKPSLVILPPITNHSCEPPKSIASFMIFNDVIVILTSRSLSHTKARRRATQSGVRIASLPGVTKEGLIRTLTGTYNDVINLSRKLADILTIGRSVQLTTPSGTNLAFSIARMRGYADTGMIHEPGQFSNLPAGEGCISPVQGTAQGTLVVDGSFPHVGKIEVPVRMTIKNGEVLRIYGKDEAKKIRNLLRPYGKDGRNIAEFGIGTNPSAKFTGCTLEDEKVKGTVHIGLGNNISFGGKVSVPCHFDCVLMKPTLVIDGKSILEAGELQV
jgi:leucyl aminopeptidase (aminopeptidase T)